MLHLLVVKSGIESRFKDIQYTRQGFVGRNVATGQQDVLPMDTFDIVSIDKLYPDLWVEIERKVEEKVAQATKDAAESIVNTTIKMMEEKLVDGGNV